MEDLLDKLLQTVEMGKVSGKSSYPVHLKGQDGAFELTKKALDNGWSPRQIIDKSLIPAMERVGRKFSEKQIFVPQMLMSAKAMGAAMVQLKPFFKSGAVSTKGTFIIGTVRGDLHDIGKNLVSMIVEGGGWSIIDLGVDVRPVSFIEILEKYPGAVIGLSALLTTTLENMANTVSQIKERDGKRIILVGGAPVTQDFCNNIGADFYSPDPQGALNYLNQMTTRQISSDILNI